jgi:iron uptake system component EfeO
VLGADALVEATRSLADAVKAGDLERARQLYLPARIAYAKIEPTAARFGDLATAIDGQADYFEKREQDPGFKGFHRLEYALFGDGDPSILTPAADALLVDVTELQARVAKLQPAPELPLEATSALLASVAQARIPHGADRYAQSDLPVLATEIENGSKVIELFRPLLSKANPALMTEVSDRLAAAQATLAGYRRQDGYLAYDKLDESARTALAKQIQDLADSVAKMNVALGLG